jgi:hypothetical protein
VAAEFAKGSEVIGSSHDRPEPPVAQVQFQPVVVPVSDQHRRGRHASAARPSA